LFDDRVPGVVAGFADGHGPASSRCVPRVVARVIGFSDFVRHSARLRFSFAVSRRKSSLAGDEATALVLKPPHEQGKVLWELDRGSRRSAPWVLGVIARAQRGPLQLVEAMRRDSPPC
jgi:hypothetical protein